MARRRKRHQNRWVHFLIISIVAIAAYWVYTSNSAATNTDIDQRLIPDLANSTGDIWWQNNYQYRQKVVTTSEPGKLTAIEFNHAALVQSGRSEASGVDIAVVAQIDKATDIIPFYFSAANTPTGKIAFDASKYPNATYYIYYGNRAATESKVLGTASTTRSSANGELLPVETPQLSISTKNRWQLLSKGKLDLQIDLATQGISNSTTSKTYLHDGEKIELVHEGALPDQSLGLQIEAKPGKADYYLVVVDNGEYWRSNTIHLLISEPVYVAWTIDWEGYNVQDQVLQRLSEISKKYGAPMTQFFNPRIYVDKSIPQYRRDELTNWIKIRQEKFGDELAMHMHMQYDLVRAAGVQPITSPRWGSGQDGYDVLTSAYSYEQFRKIVEWALEKFNSSGLGRPAGYRAGGWFANIETLKVLNDLGFVYDSSGREAYVFGNQKKPGAWQLDPKTQPYRPSTTNQNSPSPEPQLNLWEVPNNGNDSYWFPTDHLVNRFYQNYKVPGESVDQPILITYLSHPDWFDVDQPKLEALFTEISKYSHAQDKGPVVFTTISSALKAWKSN